MTDEKLKKKTIYGITWSFIELFSKQGVQLIVQIILARILLPEHFGLIGMLTIFIAISTSLVQSGMDQALIREKNPGKEDYSTVFYFNLITSVILYILLFLCAPIIADFFDEPKLIGILRIMMLVVLFNALSMIQRVILVRKIDFKTQTKITFVSSAGAGIVSILMALSGAGVWSLVIQQIIMQFLSMILLIANNRWFPALTFNKILFKKYFNFGYKLLISGIIDTTYKNIYLVIIGKLYPVDVLGYYANASKIRDVSSQSVSSAIQKVTYPVLSQIKEDKNRLATNYKKLLKVTSFLFFPFMLGLAAIAPNLIPLFLGEQWIPSVKYFQLLCIAGMLYPVHSINLNILKVKNRSDLFLFLEILKKTILTVFIVIVITLNLGVEGLIYAAIANSFISLMINTYYSAKEINYSFLIQLRDMLPSLIMSCIMTFAVVYTNYIININLFFDLFMQIIVGLIIYVCLSSIFRLKELKIILNLIRGLRR